MKKKILTIILFALVSVAAVCVFTACSDGEGDGGNDGNGGSGGNSGGNANVATYYYLDNIVYSMTGYDDQYIDVNNMSASDQETYGSVIEMYGKTVKITKNTIQFVNGSVTSQIGSSGYYMRGDKMVVDNSAMAQTFNYIKLSSGVFSIGIEQSVAGTSVKYALNYVSEEAKNATFTVRFDTQGKVDVQSKTTGYYKTISKPADPSCEGYVFGGWYKDADCKTSWNFSTNRVTGNITLYAKWTPKTYTVTFETNGGSTVSSQKVNYNETARTPSSPNKDGYTFAGWYLNKELTTPWKASDPITKDITVYAKYTAKTYKLTFDAAGGTCSTSSKTVTYDKQIGTLPTPTRSGYEFAGWYKDQYGYGEQYTSTSTVNSNVTLYAAWETTLTLDACGVGSVEQSEYLVLCGQCIGDCIDLNDATASDAIFDGWYTKPNGNGNKVEVYKMIYEPTTIYARWRLNVHYDSDGGSDVEDTTVIKGQKITEMKNPSRPGYTFDGWFYGETEYTKNTTIENTSHFTLTAHWTATE